MQQIVASTSAFCEGRPAAEISALCFGKFSSLVGNCSINSILLKTQEKQSNPILFLWQL